MRGFEISCDPAPPQPHNNCSVNLRAKRDASGWACMIDRRIPLGILDVVLSNRHKFETNVVKKLETNVLKKLIAAILGIALVCVVYLALQFEQPKLEQPKRIPANVVILEAGRYVSPNGKQIVDVSAQKDGTLKFFVSSGDGRSGGGPAAPFSAKSGWFMCWDSNDKLWTYVPEQDHKCCRNWYAGDAASGSCLVGEGGGWEGVPDSFFARLPETVKATYTTYARAR